MRLPASFPTGFSSESFDRKFCANDKFCCRVGGLWLEVRIIGPHVPLEWIRLEAGALPGLRDEVVMESSAQLAVFAYSSARCHREAVAGSWPERALPSWESELSAIGRGPRPQAL